jgi:hypothetical protein
MIVIPVELWPKGKTKGKYLLGLLTIWNDGTGTKKLGNYKYQISHAGVYFGKRKEPYKKGRVINFPRTSSPYCLIFRVLKHAGEI